MNNRAGIYKKNLSGDMAYKSFMPAVLPPNPPIELDKDIVDLLVKANKQLALLEGISSRIPNIHLFISMYVRKEALMSSQIEGTQATLEDVLDPCLEENTNRPVGDVVNYDTVCQIQENLTELIEEHKEEPQPFKLQKSDVKKLLQNSGIKEEKLENFEQVYEETAGEDAFFQAANLVEAKSVAVKTPDVTIKVSPQRMDLVQIQLVEGRRCIVIPMEDGVQINGMNVTMEGTNGTD